MINISIFVTMKSSVEQLPISDNSFNPVPWCFNGHAHTIFSSLLLNSPDIQADSVRISTPDDDFLDLDVKHLGTGKPVAVLFHGLEGNSKRFYIRRLANHLIQNGISTVAVNFRSCSDELNLKRRFYHSGETEDLETVFRWVDQNFPGSEIFACGFSLGASALLNYLKKHGMHQPVRSAVAVSTPFELKKGSLNLENGFNRVYSRLFLQTLIQKLNQKRTVYPDLPEFSGTTLYEFDDTVTAPIHGFEDADDYYNRCSSARFIDQIQTPALLIHSMEDPMCPFQWTPVDAIRKNPVTEALITEKGGHVGFWSRPKGWLNRKITAFFLKFTANG